MGLNAYEVKLQHCRDKDLPVTADLFALSIFMRMFIRTPLFKRPLNISEFVELTDYGEEYLEMQKSAFPHVSEELLMERMFRVFYYERLFFNASGCDISGLEGIINDRILSGGYALPWLYGRRLYDKYAKSSRFKAITDRLGWKDTEFLLDGEPCGVFQIGKYIAGPMGLITGEYRRAIQQNQEIDIWHCSDPNCSGIHKVNLEGNRDEYAKFVQAGARRFTANLMEQGKTESAYQGLLFSFLSQDRYIQAMVENESGPIEGWGRPSVDYSYRFIPVFLHVCFSDVEVRNIMADLLSQNREIIESALPASECEQFNCDRDTLTGLPLDVLFQASLLHSDQEIVMAIERCIDGGRIKIPGNEIRGPLSPTTGLALIYPKGVMDPWGDNDTGPVSSNLGMTVVPRSRQKKLLNLRRILRAVASDEKHSRSLEFLLSEYEGANILEQVDSILERDPREIIESVFYHDRSILADCLSMLPVGYYPELEGTWNSDKKEKLTRKILWKLGFIMHNPDNDVINEYMRNTSELQGFLEERGRSATDFENSIRGFSSNFFASLESILEESILFFTWAMLGDHFAKTHWRYSKNEARTLCSETFESYSSRGFNSLSVLVHCFSGLSKVISELKSEEEQGGAERRPHWDREGAWSRFIFPHKRFVLDMSEESIQNVLSILKHITSDLEEAQIFNIRNRTTAHQKRARQKFPQREEISECIRRIDAVVCDYLLEFGIIPMQHRPIKQTEDETGRQEWIVRSSLGSESLVRTFWKDIPGGFSLSKNKFYLFLPKFRMRDVFSTIRFEIIEESEFSRMWADYPIRVSRQNMLTDDEEEMGARKVMEFFEKMTKVELKAECSKRGLKKSGGKADLFRRLVENELNTPLLSQ